MADSTGKDNTERNEADNEQLLYGAIEANPMLWGKIFFPHHFRLPTPLFHVELIKEAVGTQKLAVAAPRESAKSTMLVFLYPFHRMVFKKTHCILLISNTFSKAAMMLEAIKKEIRENEKLKAAFPGITISKDAEGDSIITHADGFDTRFICKGVDQIGSVRGIKHGAYRPDLILGDDMEDDIMVKSRERRTQLCQLFDDALVPAGEKGRCQYIIVGTIMHDDALLAKLVDRTQYTDFNKLFYAAADEADATSLWEDKWTYEELMDIKRRKPNTFAKEYQNDPAQGGEERFNKEDFRYWRKEAEKYILLASDGSVKEAGYISECKAAISCDLAWSEKRTADNSVIMPGLLTPGNEILIDGYVARKGMRPNEIAEILFQMEERLRLQTGSSVPIGFEKAMLERVTKFILKQEMKKRDRYLLTKDLVWDKDKIGRIETRLQPRYAQHVIYHQRDMGELEHELLRFPSGIHDDIIDCEQGLVQLLQFPKQKQKAPESESTFMRLRKYVMKNAKPAHRQIGAFLPKKSGPGIPSQTSILD
jgi:hypothetical protein